MAWAGRMDTLGLSIKFELLGARGGWGDLDPRYAALLREIVIVTGAPDLRTSCELVCRAAAIDVLRRAAETRRPAA